MMNNGELVLLFFAGTSGVLLLPAIVLEFAPEK
jgi:hypothetical protein